MTRPAQLPDLSPLLRRDVGGRENPTEPFFSFSNKMEVGVRWERRRRRRSVCTLSPRNSGIYFVIYILKVVPDRFPSMNAPRNLPYQGKCLVSERRLAGTNRQKASFSLSLFSPIDWLHLGTLIRLTFPICVLLTNITIRYRFCRFAGGYQL